jgi:hypothetical protein
MRLKISIAVPFFNGEENVTPLLAEIRAVCDALGQSYEAIFVNDGSNAARNSAKPNAARCGSRLSSRRAPVYQDCESADRGSDKANRKSTLISCKTDKRDVQVHLAYTGRLKGDPWSECLAPCVD